MLNTTVMRIAARERRWHEWLALLSSHSHDSRVFIKHSIPRDHNYAFKLQCSREIATTYAVVVRPNNKDRASGVVISVKDQYDIRTNMTRWSNEGSCSSHTLSAGYTCNVDATRIKLSVFPMKVHQHKLVFRNKQVSLILRCGSRTAFSASYYNIVHLR
ncbi:hypothetical protein B0O99DRAFT_344839 [Bisporella sp. PMI_857]|nr:hypothetical protein B0O99DRAFT_344839 [Bisporella sp. PMI_857]